MCRRIIRQALRKWKIKRREEKTETPPSPEKNRRITTCAVALAHTPDEILSTEATEKGTWDVTISQSLCVNHLLLFVTIVKLRVLFH